MKKLFIFFTLIEIILTGAAIACSPKSVVITESDFTVELVEFSDAAKSYKKVVIIIPPTGGMNFIDKAYAKQLCQNQIKAVVLKNWSDNDEYSLDLNIHARLYLRAQRAIELTVKRYKDHELGILGTSVGGTHAAIATSLLPEIKSCLLIVSGGGIASIITTTSQKILVEAKEKRFEKHKFKSVEDYENALKAILPFEPLEMAIEKSKKLGMIISLNDDLVPTKNQMALKSHWKPGYVSTSRLGHVLTITWTWLFDADTVVSFFK